MRRYTHWLKVDRYASDDKKQMEVIKNYLSAYKDAKATLYFYNSGSFYWIVRLECNQSYNDLDLDVNSMSTNLTRLCNKPKDIYESKRTFEELVGLVA